MGIHMLLHMPGWHWAPLFVGHGSWQWEHTCCQAWCLGMGTQINGSWKDCHLLFMPYIHISSISNPRGEDQTYAISTLVMVPIHLLEHISGTSSPKRGNEIMPIRYSIHRAPPYPISFPYLLNIINAPPHLHHQQTSTIEHISNINQHCIYRKTIEQILLGFH